MPALLERLHRQTFAAISMLTPLAHARFLRSYFDWWHRRPDPWKVIGSEDEQHKYKMTLAQVPTGTYRTVLDVGCSEGTFTRLAAATFSEAEVTGIDISARAIARARRVAGRATFAQQNLLDHFWHGRRADLVFCSEMLYYLGRDDRLSTASERLISVLEPDGVLVVVHPWPDALRLHHYLDVDPRLARISGHLDEGTRQTFAIAVYRRGADSASPGQARYSRSACA
ncbi:MAG TPA: SAM-dependent methyltransferase [Actinopolymorphaceae bacterium]